MGCSLYDVASYTGTSKLPTVVCYCRVSSSKQRADLDSQIAYMRGLYPQAEIITDIASGLNYKRKGLKTLLARGLSGDQLTVVVAHKDRLARFGVELIEWILQSCGSELLVLNQSISDPQRELTEDLLAIIQIFSCRLYGQRRYTNNKMSKDSSISDSSTEEHFGAVVRDLQSSLQQID
ncbi:MAG: IS607 family transposase [Chamaesiphon sp.]|nr:IS607 family transposase [Chamaesiphon sp.]